MRSVTQERGRPMAPGEWQLGGTLDEEARAAYGFGEVQVALAALSAYMETWAMAPAGVERATLRAALVRAFADEIERLPT